MTDKTKDNTFEEILYRHDFELALNLFSRHIPSGQKIVVQLDSFQYHLYRANFPKIFDEIAYYIPQRPGVILSANVNPYKNEVYTKRYEKKILRYKIPYCSGVSLLSAQLQVKDKKYFDKEYGLASKIAFFNDYSLPTFGILEDDYSLRLYWLLNDFFEITHVNKKHMESIMNKFPKKYREENSDYCFSPISDLFKDAIIPGSTEIFHNSHGPDVDPMYYYIKFYGYSEELGFYQINSVTPIYSEPKIFRAQTCSLDKFFSVLGCTPPPVEVKIPDILSLLTD